MSGRNAELRWHLGYSLPSRTSRSWILSWRLVPSILFLSSRKHCFTNSDLLCLWAVLWNHQRALGIWYQFHEWTGRISGLEVPIHLNTTVSTVLINSRWLFILEGIPAVLCGIYTYFMLPNYPETSNLLSEEDKRIIIDNLPKTQPSSRAKTFDLEQFKGVFRNPTTITFVLIWICHAIGGWGVQTVLPTVIFELGLTGSATSQLMTMPTYVSLLKMTALYSTTLTFP